MVCAIFHRTATLPEMFIYDILSFGEKCTVEPFDIIPGNGGNKRWRRRFRHEDWICEGYVMGCVCVCGSVGVCLSVVDRKSVV